MYEFVVVSTSVSPPVHKFAIKSKYRVQTCPILPNLGQTSFGISQGTQLVNKRKSRAEAQNDRSR